MFNYVIDEVFKSILHIGGQTLANHRISTRAYLKQVENCLLNTQMVFWKNSTCPGQVKSWQET